MVAGIVQLAAQTGHPVVACARLVEALERVLRYLRKGLSRFADRGAFSAEEADEHYDRIHWTVSLEEMVRVDAVIEAIVESVAQEAFAALDRLLPSDALLLTNRIALPLLATADRTRSLQFFRLLILLKRFTPSLVIFKFVALLVKLDYLRLVEKSG